MKILSTKRQKLKSSPVPISFISFDRRENKCNYCGLEFFLIPNCLTWYTKYLTDNNIYLDVYTSTKYAQCSEHKPRNSNYYIQNIQERCILSWTDVHDKNCKLCGKSIDPVIEVKCSDCYLISSGWIESTFRKSIPILYLPWWDSTDRCIVCVGSLRIITDCQKWCSDCQVIFEITGQSQCKKCKGILSINIDITNLVSGNYYYR